jgi:hypothetical protein
MTLAQSMPRSIAAAIVDAVAADAACRQYIPTVSPFFLAQRGAGGLRNFVNMSAEGAAWVGVKAVELVHAKPDATQYAKDYWEKQGVDQACTNIADVTDKAITLAIQQKRIPQWVTAARPVSRSPSKTNHVLAEHTATGVQTADGKVYVFDWHATLMLRNPLISRSLDEWQSGNDPYRSAFSTFQGWG